jgi:truncated hemoglobin YjbI
VDVSRTEDAIIETSFERDDLYVGYRRDETHHHAALLPGWILRWRRKTQPDTQTVEAIKRLETTPHHIALPPPHGPADLVSHPPTVRGDSVRDWLKHYSWKNRTWGEAVAEFYTRAAADPEVAPYFHRVKSLPELQRHFTAAMVMVTSDGLTAEQLRRMAVKHAGVTTPDGTPITGRVYDKVIGVLKQILKEWGVPSDAIADLERVVQPLRAMIVVEE